MKEYHKSLRIFTSTTSKPKSLENMKSTRFARTRRPRPSSNPLILPKTAKVERMLGTLIRPKQKQSTQTEDDSGASGDTLVADSSVGCETEQLIPYETISKPWSFDPDIQKKAPKRLLQPGVFEEIANVRNCRVVQRSHGDVMVVKGDSHDDVDQTIAALDGMVKRLVGSSRYLDVEPWQSEVLVRSNSSQSICYLSFPVYDFTVSKRKINVSYCLVTLDESKAYPRQLRTLMRKAGLHNKDSPKFVIIRKITESGRSGSMKVINKQSVSLSLDHHWNNTSFEPYGPQQLDHSGSRSDFNSATSHVASTTASTRHPAHRSIEEWVKQSDSTEHNPFMPLRPLDQNSEQGAPSIVADHVSDKNDGSSKQDPVLGGKKRHIRARRIPIDSSKSSVTPGSVKEEDQCTASEQADSTADVTNSMTRSYSGGGPSFSITPLHSSATHDTLPADIFPVIAPLPAIAGPYMPPDIPGRLFTGGPQEPAWLARNPTSETLTSKTTPLIWSPGAEIESEATTKDPWLEQTSHEVAAVTERIATTDEVDQRQLWRTMRQKNPKPSSPTELTQPMESSCSKILQVAQESKGLFTRLEVEIGMILLEKATLPPIYSQRKTLTAEEVPKLFLTQGVAKTETVFVNE